MAPSARRKASALGVYHLSVPSYCIQPWKNGRGDTREIAIDSEKPFRWRVSSAILRESASFSVFSGYDRILTLTGNTAITLEHEDNRPRIVAPMQVYRFSGDVKTQFHLKAPTEDFNVIVLRGRAKASVYPSFVSKGEELQFQLSAQEHFIYCVKGTLECLEQNSGQRCALGPNETLRISRFSPAEYLNLRAKAERGDAELLWVVIHLS